MTRSTLLVTVLIAPAHVLRLIDALELGAWSSILVHRRAFRGYVNNCRFGAWRGKAELQKRIFPVCRPGDSRLEVFSEST